MQNFCDVNVLLALVSGRHTHHECAKIWLDSVADGEGVICRVAQLGLLRLLNNPTVMGEDVLDSEACLSLWAKLLADGRFEFVTGEPMGLDEQLGKFISSKAFTHQLWTDAYFAAFACASAMTLVSFDKGFTRFPGLNLSLLQQIS